MTKNWKKLPFAIWALLTPPEPLLHSSRPLFTCKLQIWVTLKAVLYAAFFGLLLAIEKFYDFQPNYSDPIVRVLFVAICAQWPLFLSLRQASYPRSNFNCKLPEDFTTEEVPIHLLKIWWDTCVCRGHSRCSDVLCKAAKNYVKALFADLPYVCWIAIVQQLSIVCQNHQPTIIFPLSLEAFMSPRTPILTETSPALLWGMWEQKSWRRCWYLIRSLLR